MIYDLVPLEKNESTCSANDLLYVRNVQSRHSFVGVPLALALDGERIESYAVPEIARM